MVLESMIEDAMAETYSAMKDIPDDMKLSELEDLSVSLSFHLTACRALTDLLATVGDDGVDDDDDDDFDEEDY